MDLSPRTSASPLLGISEEDDEGDSRLKFWARMGRSESAASLSGLALSSDGDALNFGRLLRERSASVSASLSSRAGGLSLSPPAPARLKRVRAPTAPVAYRPHEPMAKPIVLRPDAQSLLTSEGARSGPSSTGGGDEEMGAVDEEAPALVSRVVVLLCLCQIAHFYSMCSIFSYAGFLCVDAGWVKSADRAGFLAGLLATMLPLGRLPTSVLWGHLADRAGRRVALMGCMSGVALGQLAFAFCTDLRAALAVRFVLLGGGNGWNSILGPICAENAGGDTYQSARLVGYVFGAGGVINMLGPAIGGITYGWGPIGSRFPAFVPSIIGTALGALAAFLTWLWLPETKPEAARIPKAPERQGRASASPLAPARLGAAGEDASKVPLRTRPSLTQALRTAPVPAMLVLRSGIGMAAFASYDVIPLWAIASLDAGGVALTKASLGLMLAAAASVQLLWTTFAMGPVMGRLGSRRTFVGGCCAGAAALVALPHAHRLPLAAVVPLVAAQSAALNTACTASIVATNSAVGVVAHHLAGALNGVLVTAESVAKALGPALVAPIFAAAITARPEYLGQPSGAALTFTGLASLVALFGVGAARYLTLLDAHEGHARGQVPGRTS